MVRDTLYALGDALIDFLPDSTGCDFNHIRAFYPNVGGAPTNVCGAFARLGGHACILTQLGDDPFGHRIEQQLTAYGVDTRYVRFTDKAKTALAFVCRDTDGSNTYTFYRDPSADMLLSARQIQKNWFGNAFALHSCSVALADAPMKKAYAKAVGYARQAGAIVSFDANLRFPMWPSREALRRAVLSFLPQADLIKVSDDELEFLTGESDIQKAAPMLLKGSTKLVIVTCGAGDPWAFTPSVSAKCAAVKVTPVDTTGAGDGFIGSFLFQLYRVGIGAEDLAGLNKKELGVFLRYSSRFCGISVQKRGAVASYPTARQMEQ